jgi:hypothetical protein
MIRIKLLLGFVSACWLLLMGPLPATAAENNLQLDFDNSDPVELRAKIMEIDHEKARLVVAEEVIFVVDFMIGEYRFFTEVNDAEGNPYIFEDFHEGDYVLVKGFKNADGVVMASLLQKAEKQRKRIRHKDNRSR